MCSAYGIEHDIKYNSAKSNVMIFCCNKMKDIHIPNFLLNNVLLTRVTKYKYLGHCISDARDDDDMARQYRQSYAQGNALLRKFFMCTESVKITLFRSFCTSLYTCELWCQYRSESLRKLCVAYNNVFRFVCREPRNCSASHMFVSRGLPTCNMLIRKSIYAFMISTKRSCNTILQNIVGSDHLYTSPLNLTQHIEDGFETGKITGIVLVDLSAAYDTVNHRRLLEKVYNMTRDYRLMCMIRTLLENRRFFVELGGKRSRWRSQRNGLPQGSVLAPLLFNVYTNDQPIHPGTRSFVYADDLAVTTQSTEFAPIEETLTSALVGLSEYYTSNQLRANPTKTQVSLFHLRNRECGKQLKISWNGVNLTHCNLPVYLGVTLDRTLSYKAHIEKTKKKVGTRNNIIRKLRNSKWGATPTTLRSSALALCYSAAEYACPVWERSTHAKKLNATLNETCRMITGCLKPTNINSLPILAGIAPSDIRRAVASRTERTRQTMDERHPLNGHLGVVPRLKSRKSFIKCTEPINTTAKAVRLELWRERLEPLDASVHLNISADEHLPAGEDYPWTTWKALNRLRTQVGRSRVNMSKWGYSNETETCDCGIRQTMQHLLVCPMMNTACSPQDLTTANDIAIGCARHWEGTI